MTDMKIISRSDDAYPKLLKNIYDPPERLYCKGELKDVDSEAVAVVGSRRCSSYGFQMAESLAFDLARMGVTVISGMARGIDTAAHKGALKAGGRTIAVMGSGFDHIYPAGSEDLVRMISENGAVLTEYSPDIFPSKRTFPRRNRIISGMSRGVLVVEAARKSGAMITVNMALEQGREVFAVPGRADFYTSSGTNFLIQNGAKLVMSVEDILEELNMETREVGGKEAGRQGSKEAGMSEESVKVLNMLEEEPVHIDRLLENMGTDFGRLSEVLLKLEIKGAIKARPGKNYIRSGLNADQKEKVFKD